MDFAVWKWLVLNDELSASNASAKFGGPLGLDAGPGWCFSRFGYSETVLPDGRTIRIGGEHEDYYDPDFYIYNDVVVLTPSEGDPDVAIYGYPVDVFPATDFHSATLVGGRILVIGCIGYGEQKKVGVTPVFALDLSDMSFSEVQTTGDGPGWICQHTAVLSEDGKQILVSRGVVERKSDRLDNVNEFALTLDTGRWTQLTQVACQQWSVSRIDGKRFSISDLQFAAKAADRGFGVTLDIKKKALKAKGGSFDLETVKQLFVPPRSAPHEGDGEDADRLVARVTVDECTVGYIEDMERILVKIEGDLSEAKARVVCEDLATKLARLHGVECKVERDGRYDPPA